MGACIVVIWCTYMLRELWRNCKFTVLLAYRCVKLKNPHLQKVKPAVNQVEIHPWLQRRELVQFCKDNGIIVQAYSSLAKAAKLADPKVTAIANRHGVTNAQVLIA
jgi:hypothetical protein